MLHDLLFRRRRRRQSEREIMNNYFFVDGGALLADIPGARKGLSLPKAARLDLTRFARYFTSNFEQFSSGGFRRFVFYIVNDDHDRIQANLRIPDHRKPGAVEDLRLEYCGKRLRQVEKARNWLEENGAPEYVRESIYRSEKAVDTQICCDALQLAATGKLDRLFLYTNDLDFVPLCRSIRQLGANINLFHLRPDEVNEELVKECDAYHVISEEHSVKEAFVDENGRPYWPPQPQEQ
jgi:uncharacterized LabA/DUF88 family protein